MADPDDPDGRLHAIQQLLGDLDDYTTEDFDERAAQFAQVLDHWQDFDPTSDAARQAYRARVRENVAGARAHYNALHYERTHGVARRDAMREHTTRFAQMPEDVRRMIADTVDPGRADDANVEDILATYAAGGRDLAFVQDRLAQHVYLQQEDGPFGRPSQRRAAEHADLTILQRALQRDVPLGTRRPHAIAGAQAAALRRRWAAAQKYAEELRGDRERLH